MKPCLGDFLASLVFLVLVYEFKIGVGLIVYVTTMFRGSLTYINQFTETEFHEYPFSRYAFIFVINLGKMLTRSGIMQNPNN